MNENRRLTDKLNVLVCDDSAFSRVTLRKIIESDETLRVVDAARNGKEAVEKAVKLKPDVILMDVTMPVMDGLAALKEIVKIKLAPVIMVSSPSHDSATVTIEAMQAGAFDFIPKPEGAQTLTEYGTLLLQKVKKAVESDIYKKIDEETTHFKAIRDMGDVIAGKSTVRGGLGFKVVALGISTGGPRSIFKVLPHLPRDLNAAVIVVQHMPNAFIPPFTQRLDSKTSMACRETDAGMALEPGNIYVARGGYHLKLVRKSNGRVVIRQTQDPPHLFMPAVDIMMESVVEVFGSDTIGVLMTGMGRDGAEGMVKIKESGGVTIAESKETAVVFGMPYEAVKRGGADIVVPNWDIASKIIKSVGGKP